MSASASVATPWRIRSDLPGRLRLGWEPLRQSSSLRRHCNRVLIDCHWLHGYRLNPIAGSLCVRFPEARRAEVMGVLARALRPAATNHGGAQLAESAARLQRRHPSLARHGVLCVTLVGLDLTLGLPALLVNGAASLLLIPLLLEAWRKLRRRPPQLAEALDAGFSALLIRQGLGREALLDLVLEDGTLLLQRLDGDEEQAPHEIDLIRRIGERVTVLPVHGTHPIPLADARPGDRLHLAAGQMVMLQADVLEGALVVIDPRVGGEWHPQRLGPGDDLEPGWLVLRGEATVRVRRPFHNDPVASMPMALQLSPPTLDGRMARLLQLYNRVVDPLLLLLGVGLALRGASDRALAAFQFNPLSDWQTSQWALRLAARADLRLHGVHFAHPQVLDNVASLRRVLMSTAGLDRLRRVVPREHLAPGSGLEAGALLRLLAGLQEHLLALVPSSLGGAIEVDGDPWPVKEAHPCPGGTGWDVVLEDGRHLTVRPGSLSASSAGAGSLEVWHGDACWGQVALELELDPFWVDVREALRSLEIEVQTLPPPPLGGDEVAWRLAAVEELQRQGLKVGYIGDGLVDIPAMARADVAIGLTGAEEGFPPAPLCDLVLGGDVRWLPRLVVLSRELQRTARANGWLISLTHALSSVATAGLAISPLQSVLLADLPLLIAEWKNQQSFITHHPSLAAGS